MAKKKFYKFKILERGKMICSGIQSAENKTEAVKGVVKDSKLFIGKDQVKKKYNLLISPAYNDLDEVFESFLRDRRTN